MFISAEKVWFWSTSWKQQTFIKFKATTARKCTDCTATVVEKPGASDSDRWLEQEHKPSQENLLWFQQDHHLFMVPQPRWSLQALKPQTPKLEPSTADTTVPKVFNSQSNFLPRSLRWRLNSSWASRDAAVSFISTPNIYLCSRWRANAIWSADWASHSSLLRLTIPGKSPDGSSAPSAGRWRGRRHRLRERHTKRSERERLLIVQGGICVISGDAARTHMTAKPIRGKRMLEDAIEAGFTEPESMTAFERAGENWQVRSKTTVSGRT